MNIEKKRERKKKERKSKTKTPPFSFFNSCSKGWARVLFQGPLSLSPCLLFFLFINSSFLAYFTLRDVSSFLFDFQVTPLSFYSIHRCYWVRVCVCLLVSFRVWLFVLKKVQPKKVCVSLHVCVCLCETMCALNYEPAHLEACDTMRARRGGSVYVRVCSRSRTFMHFFPCMYETCKRCLCVFTLFSSLS